MDVDVNTEAVADRGSSRHRGELAKAGSVHLQASQTCHKGSNFMQ